MVYNRFELQALKPIGWPAYRVCRVLPVENLRRMLFRPKFCTNCGEKIERADWGLFTSRRFCMVCESEFKGQDLIPRVAVIVGLFIGVVGFTSYLRSGTSATNSLVTRQPAKFVDQRQMESPSPPQIKTEAATPPAVANLPQTLAAEPASKQVVKPTLATGQEYYCGAETKKGTPCTRKVKGNTRCYQHKGMPAMLPAEKLRIG